MSSRFRTAAAHLERDPAELRRRDRAVLRILNRSGAATAAQLTVLAYRNRRLAQACLRRLWSDGLLERALLPPSSLRGGAPYAYRLSRGCLRRLGYRRIPPRGPGYLTHTLDAVDAVCALVAAGDPDRRPLVQLWLPESIVADALPDGPRPDALVVLDDGRRSGVLCLEIDEATQHVAPIRAKLRAYREALAVRRGWHVVFAVPTAARGAWLGRAARGADLSLISAWAVTSAQLSAHGIEAPLTSLADAGRSTTLGGALTDVGPRRSAAPVGSGAWLDLLGSGAGEELEALLR